MSQQFGADQTTDQKRSARGLHLLAARNHLQALHGRHHPRLNVAILAGGAPGAEIAAIRELMRGAKIIAFDQFETCIDAARRAGADESVCCDLTPSVETRVHQSSTVEHVLPCAAVQQRGPFDLFSLDLCSEPNEKTRNLWRAYKKSISRGGVLILTFSYGRDVVPMLRAAQQQRVAQAAKTDNQSRRMVARMSGVPDKIAMRLCYMFDPAEFANVRSVITYGGNEMPMLSALYVTSAHRRDLQARDLSYVKLSADDWPPLVLDFDPAVVFDCPKDQVLAMRRSAAAKKAVATRRAAGWSQP